MLKKKTLLAASAAFAMFCAIAFADQAYWYRWVNLENGTMVCTQTPPGDNWAVQSGPYKDARCTRRVDNAQ